MNLSFQGFHENAATFAGSVPAGQAVRLSASGTVAACANDAVFCGVSGGGSDGYVSVQLTGYVCLPYTGTAPAVGYGKLAADGNGGVKTGAAGRDYLILNVDTTRGMVGFLLA